MKAFRIFPVLSGLVALLAGCVGVTPLAPGASQSEVRAAWGAPTVQTKTAAGERWTYSTAPEGRTVWLLEFDAGGRKIGRAHV